MMLPKELLGIVINSMYPKDVASLCRSNKQIHHDIASPNFGYHVHNTVDIRIVYDPNQNYTRRPYIIGRFDRFKIKYREDAKYLPSYTKLLHLLIHSCITDIQMPLQLTHLTLETNPSFSRLNLLHLNRTSEMNLHLLTCLTHLMINGEFCQSINGLRLPNSLTHLTFGIHFNKPIHGIKLPNALTHLVFEGFNHPITNVKFPDSLLYLDMGAMFNKPIDQLVLPSSLSYLRFGINFHQPIQNLILPNSLQHLVLQCNPRDHINNLRLPMLGALAHLTLGRDFNDYIDKLILPNTLKHLEFGYLFNRPINKLKLPTSVTHLSFGQNFDQPLDQLQIPPNSLLAYVSIYKHNYYSKKIELPDNITVIRKYQLVYS